MKLKKRKTMNPFKLRPYDSASDEPRTGWDNEAVNYALASGKRLYVDENGEIWTAGLKEYIGAVRKCIDKPDNNGERGRGDMRDKREQELQNYPAA